MTHEYRPRPHLSAPPAAAERHHPGHDGRRDGGPGPRPRDGGVLLRPAGAGPVRRVGGRLRLLRVALPPAHPPVRHRGRPVRLRHRPAPGPQPARQLPLLDPGAGGGLRHHCGQAVLRRPGPELHEPRPGRPDAGRHLPHPHDQLAPAPPAPGPAGGGRGVRRHPPVLPSRGDAAPPGAGPALPGGPGGLHGGGVRLRPAAGLRLSAAAPGDLPPGPPGLSGNGGRPVPGVLPRRGQPPGLDRLSAAQRRPAHGGGLLRHRPGHHPGHPPGAADVRGGLRPADHAAALLRLLPRGGGLGHPHHELSGVAHGPAGHAPPLRRQPLHRHPPVVHRRPGLPAGDPLRPAQPARRPDRPESRTGPRRALPGHPARPREDPGPPADPAGGHRRPAHRSARVHRPGHRPGRAAPAPGAPGPGDAPGQHQL